MKVITLVGCAAALTVALSGFANAKNDKPSKGKKAKAHSVQTAKRCPRGLAKKANGCQPPGQAKKSNRAYRKGDVFRKNSPKVRDYARYGLPRLKNGKSYYRVGDSIFAVNDDTRLILDIIRVANRLNN